MAWAIRYLIPPGKDDPGTPDESDDVTIDVTIYVKDWVKRTNKDIIL